MGEHINLCLMPAGNYSTLLLINTDTPHLPNSEVEIPFVFLDQIKTVWCFSYHRFRRYFSLLLVSIVIILLDLGRLLDEEVHSFSTVNAFRVRVQVCFRERISTIANGVR